MRVAALTLTILLALTAVASAADLVGYIAVGAPPYGVAVDASRQRAYVAAGSRVIVIDTTTDSVVGLVSVGERRTWWP